uniref:Peptidase A2 domain-containing protein n=1 Tax=Acrobeloides nanus TaxID=290746 RepID=A0A914EGN3_9BILA
MANMQREQNERIDRVSQLLLIILMIVAGGQGANAVFVEQKHNDPVLICQTKIGRTIWRSPIEPVCPKVNFNDPDEVVYDETLDVYKPNTMKYETQAVVCKVVKDSVRHYTNLLNDDFEEKVSEEFHVSASECMRMIDHKICDQGFPEKKVTVKGELKNGGVYETENVLDYKLKYGDFSRRVTYVVNCYVYGTIVGAYHGSTSIISPAGDLGKAKYAQGNANLKEGAIVIWEPEEKAGCEYSYFQKMSGKRMGDVWLSKSKEFALSITDANTELVDCKTTLLITDQGFAVRRSMWSPKRRVRRDVGEEWKEFSKKEAGPVMSPQLSAQLTALDISMIDSIKGVFEHTIAAMCERMKILFQQNELMLAAEPTLAVRRWLNKPNVHARYVEGFVEIWPCIELPEEDLTILPSTTQEGCYDLPLVEYGEHNHTRRGYLDQKYKEIRNESEIVTCESRAREMRIEEGATTLSENNNICDLKRSEREMNFLVLNEAKREQKKLETDSHSVQGDPEAWPPRVTTEMSLTSDRGVEFINASYASGGKPVLCVGQINGVWMKMLIDTGATMTIAPESMMQLMKAKPEPYSSSAQGITGDAVQIKNKAKVLMQIAGTERETYVYLASGSHLGIRTSYDILIGTDTLKKFSPITIDLERNVMNIGGKVIRICDPNSSTIKRTPLNLRDTVDIPPNSMKFVECVMAVSEVDKKKDFSVDKQHKRLSEKDLYLPPCIVTPEKGDEESVKVKILIVNPTQRSVRLYNGMTIASVIELKNENGRLIEEIPEIYNVEENKDEVYEDPTYVVDISQAEVSEVEKKLLKELIDEYQDIF